VANAPRPAVVGGRPREVRSADDGENGSPVTLPTASVQAVYDGRTCIGFLLPRGKIGIEAFDADQHSLGVFPTIKAAVAAFPTTKGTAS
jgi:hypothetical protein